jgi:hypothetical protein
MANIGKLIEEGKLQKAADLLPAPDEMESDFGTIEQTSVPAKTVFYSIRRNGNCAFEKKGPEKHKLFFFCKDTSLCIEALGEEYEDHLPIWEVCTKKELKIIRIKGWRHEFLKPYYKDYLDVGYYDEEKILSYYLIKHNLDGFQAAAEMDQTASSEKNLYEFAFLEDVVEKEIVIQRCLPVRELLQQKTKKRKLQREKKNKKRKRSLKF